MNSDSGEAVPADTGPKWRARALALTIGVVAAILINLLYGDRLFGSVVDSWQRQSPRDLTETEVDVVTIDLASLDRHGEWPWPRAYLADLIHKIAAQGPKVITLDMLFDSPDSHNPAKWAALYPELAEQLSPGAQQSLMDLPAMDDRRRIFLRRRPGGVRHHVFAGRQRVDEGGLGAFQQHCRHRPVP